MALYRRLSPAPSDGERDDTPNRLAVNKPHTKYQLLTAREVPPWYADTFIRTGYRPVTGSVSLCMDSLRYIHNETASIYSHLVPAGVTVIGNGLFHFYFRAHYPSASLAEQLPFHIYLSTSVLCFGISSLYHILLCHSEEYAALWVRMDYTAIVFQILGSFISGIYVSFHCEPGLRILYWSMICILGLLTAIVVLSPRFQSDKWRMLRLSAFVATGFSAFAPIIHAVTIFPYDQLMQLTGLAYYLMEGLAVITGVAFYATRFPESRMPDKFDIWGASHQIFHLFIVLSAAIHFWGILQVFDRNYNHPRCPI